MQGTKKLTFLGLLAAIAIVLSYVENLLPPFFGNNGIKLGLANIVNIFLLYKFTIKEAALVTLVRVLLVSTTFDINTLPYSVVGAAFSIIIMALLKKSNLFSIIAVSIAGGVCHNAGQILVAMFAYSTSEIGYTIIPLCISGILSGTLIGIAGALILKYTKYIKGW